MYIVTFYSFKGGVGRTMAMANVGLSLARAGRKVLLVDFDLEAPGLDTFDLLRPSEPTPGLVDFVTEYRTTRVAPDVKNFVYEPSHPGLDANVWVMPTGKQDGDYGCRLNAIDWARLYTEEDGYLLFEDLKQQWLRELQPDYVFIDSRTGHTDVGGICTRQLPDAVVLLFFPNEQNRRGLDVVVRDINRESRESGRSIQQYFVAANVPTLDDDESILRKALGQFHGIIRGLPDATIHHYDSLLLIQQLIFTIQRPQTKLAREYDRLAKLITSANLGDRAVVTEFLDTVHVSAPRPIKPEVIDERLKTIQRLYAQDGAILYALGQANRNLGREKDAQHLLKQAANLGFLSEENMAEQAAKQYSAGALESARKLVRKALALTTTRVFAVANLLAVVVKHDVDFLAEVLRTINDKGVQPEDRIYIATRLEVNRNALAAVADFLRPLAAMDHPTQVFARTELSLCLIGQRLFAEAEALILSGGQSLAELDIQSSFNYAMALWGRSKTVPRDLFLRVVNLAVEQPPTRVNANYLQCLAIAHYSVGNREMARELALQARASSVQDLDFSAWRYLRMARQEFLKDMDSLGAMIETGRGQPVIVDDSD